MNKYVFRRALVGVVITPLVAFTYLVGYATLVGAGAEPTSTPSEVWNNGLMIGVIISVWFALDAIKLGRGRK